MKLVADRNGKVSILAHSLRTCRYCGLDRHPILDHECPDPLMLTEEQIPLIRIEYLEIRRDDLKEQRASMVNLLDMMEKGLKMFDEVIERKKGLS